MSSATKTIVFGLVGIISGRVLWTVMSGSDVAGSFFPDKELQTALEQGFKESSPDWDGWVKARKASLGSAKRRYGSSWKDSLSAQHRRWGARAAVEYTTREEVAELYRWRADMFSKVAGNPKLNGLCGGTQSDPKSLATAELAPFVRLVGKAFGRQHARSEIWEPSLDLANDEAAWESFGTYLASNEMRGTLNTLMQLGERRKPPNQQICTSLAALYRRAADYPDDRVGNVDLLEFVRSLDLLAAVQ